MVFGIVIGIVLICALLSIGFEIGVEKEYILVVEDDTDYSIKTYWFSDETGDIRELIRERMFQMDVKKYRFDERTRNVFRGKSAKYC